MDGKTYNRTQKVIDTLNKAEQLPKGKSIPREEFLRLLRELHQNLEEMFWAGDFKKEGESE
jgi:hypothetical protein